jgi:hypothetical protein
MRGTDLAGGSGPLFMRVLLDRKPVKCWTSLGGMEGLADVFLTFNVAACDF